MLTNAKQITTLSEFLTLRSLGKCQRLHMNLNVPARAYVQRWHKSVDHALLVGW